MTETCNYILFTCLDNKQFPKSATNVLEDMPTPEKELLVENNRNQSDFRMHEIKWMPWPLEYQWNEVKAKQIYIQSMRAQYFTTGNILQKYKISICICFQYLQSNISRDLNSLVISTSKKNQLAYSALYPDTGDAWAQAFPGRRRNRTKR